MIFDEALGISIEFNVIFGIIYKALMIIVYFVLIIEIFKCEKIV